MNATHQLIIEKQVYSNFDLFSDDFRDFIEKTNKIDFEKLKKDTDKIDLKEIKRKKKKFKKIIKVGSIVASIAAVISAIVLAVIATPAAMASASIVLLISGSVKILSEISDLKKPLKSLFINGYFKRQEKLKQKPEKIRQKINARVEEIIDYENKLKSLDSDKFTPNKEASDRLYRIEEQKKCLINLATDMSRHFEICFETHRLS